MPEDVVCAGYFTAKAQPCVGDSGGPLVVEDEGRFYLTGIVSFGADDVANGIKCKRGYPVIFTDVSRYEDWIVKTMKKLLLPS